VKGIKTLILFALHLQLAQSAYAQGFKPSNIEFQIIIGPISNTEAIERVEWAFQCGYFGSPEEGIYAREIKHQMLFDENNNLRQDIRYPLITVTSPEPFQPVLGVDFKLNRHDSCNHAYLSFHVDYTVTKKAKKSISGCELTRYQAYYDQYITEAEYLDMVLRHIAPAEEDAALTAPCYDEPELSCFGDSFANFYCEHEYLTRRRSY
jgi:hypothetical protein